MQTDAQGEQSATQASHLQYCAILQREQRRSPAAGFPHPLHLRSLSGRTARRAHTALPAAAQTACMVCSCVLPPPTLVPPLPLPPPPFDCRLARCCWTTATNGMAGASQFSRRCTHKAGSRRWQRRSGACRLLSAAAACRPPAAAEQPPETTTPLCRARTLEQQRRGAASAPETGHPAPCCPWLQQLT